MATYNTSDVIKQLLEILTDGYGYVDISELEGDDEFPTSLSFTVLDDQEDINIDYESIESLDESLTAPSSKFKATDICPEATFTYQELFTLMYSIEVTLDRLKEWSAEPLPKKDLDEIKQSTVDCRNLQAKFSTLRKLFKIV